MEYLAATKKKKAVAAKPQPMSPQVGGSSSLSKYMIIGGAIFLVVAGIAIWRSSK
jgi:hypothetical protein